MSTSTAPPPPLRVLLAISNLEYGGAQRQVVELANAADPVRMDVRVCSLSAYTPLAAELDGRDRRLHVIEKAFKFDVSVVPRLAWLLRRLRIDVVQSYLFDAEIAVRLAGRIARVPLVVGSERNTDYSLKPIQQRAYRLTHGCVDLIIANSNAGAAFNGRTLGHPARQYRVVHNGVDTKKFRPRDAGPIRRSLGLAPHEPVVGVFASFKVQKNHPLFLAAARRVLSVVPDVRFMFVGDQLYAGMHGSDAYKARVEAIVDEMGIRGRCLFLGNRDDVEQLYSACDLTVLPSLFEGTPNVALESMACGIPVVATAVSDNAFVVPDGQAGLIVPLEDDAGMAAAICRLLTERGLRDRLSATARNWVESEFSTRRLAEKTEAAFREGLKEHSDSQSRPR